MDINDYAFGNGLVTPEQQRQIAAALRNRDQMGAIMALSGDRAAAPVGQQMAKSANVERQQGVNQNYYQGLLRSQAAALEERKREANMRNSLGQAQIASNERIRGALIEKPWSPKQQDQMRFSLGTLESMNKLRDTYNSKWESSIPGMGVFKQYAARVAPNMTKALMGQDALDFKAWYDDLNRAVEAGIKNKLFGSALTEPEIKSWQSLTIDPAANAQQIKAWYDRNIPKIEADLARQVRAAQVLYPRQVGALLGNPDPGQPDPGPDPMYDVEDIPDGP